MDGSEPGAASHFKNSSLRPKNFSTASASAPLSPERSVLPPHAATTASSAPASSASSPHERAVITPSALNGVPANIFSLSSKSETETESAPRLPMFSRISRAQASSRAPVSEDSSMSASFSESEPSASASGFLSAEHAQRQAATMSSRLMRPSESASIKSRVFWSKNSPRVGQLSAAHSFMSSSPMAAMSAPVSIEGWKVPPALKNFHLRFSEFFWFIFSLFLVFGGFARRSGLRHADIPCESGRRNVVRPQRRGV